MDEFDIDYGLCNIPFYGGYDCHDEIKKNITGYYFKEKQNLPLKDEKKINVL